MTIRSQSADMTGLAPFALRLPPNTRFGRGAAMRVAAEVAALGPPLIFVHGGDPVRSADLRGALDAAGVTLQTVACSTEPTLDMLTDALDGYLARRWRVISRYGRIMDPLADKLLVLTAFVYLASPIFLLGAGELGTGDDASDAFMASRVAPWMVAVILGRELAVTSLRGLLESEGADASANAAGKAKMGLQAVCVPVVRVRVATASTNPGDWAGYVSSGLAWATVAATAASAWPYIRAAVRHTRAA